MVTISVKTQTAVIYGTSVDSCLIFGKWIQLPIQRCLLWRREPAPSRACGFNCSALLPPIAGQYSARWAICALAGGNNSQGSPWAPTSPTSQPLLPQNLSHVRICLKFPIYHSRFNTSQPEIILFYTIRSNAIFARFFFRKSHPCFSLLFQFTFPLNLGKQLISILIHHS